MRAAFVEWQTPQTNRLTPQWLVAFILAALFAFGVKLYWAYATEGAADVSLWIDFLSRIRECGTCVYQTGGIMIEHGGQRVNPFNHPPFILHYLRLLGFLSDLTGLPFRFVFRLVTSLFDLGSLV